MIDTFAAFNRFIGFFSELFSQPGLLADAACRQSYKDYVPGYFRDVFGPTASLNSPRHVRWYRRLAPVLALPPGSRILDYGGGYGMDTIFLASLGYSMVFYELTSHHIGIARWFADRFAGEYGKLPIEYVLVGLDKPPSGLDAVFADEVTHHIEPAQRVFQDAAAMLRSGGHFILLEPNYLNPITQAFFIRARGLQTTKWLVNDTTGERYLWGNEHIRPYWTWNQFARAAGFELHDLRFVSPWYSGPMSEKLLLEPNGLEKWPLVRTILTSHVGIDYAKK